MKVVEIPIWNKVMEPTLTSNITWSQAERAIDLADVFYWPAGVHPRGTCFVE